jgi:GNAT superfamily N-acetyltransferase
MLIRTAIAADVPHLATLVRQYWEFESIAGFDRPRIEALLRGLLAAPERGGCWVVDEGRELAGYLLATYMFSLEHGGLMAEIDEFFVTSAGRSVGVGSRLLEAAERDIRALGVARMQLQLAVGNGRARSFYARHAFVSRSGYELLDKPLRGLR